MDQFYVTLPSNTISDRRNTASQFTVHLPQKLRLSGEWECGLCQIIYPHNWETLKKSDAEIKISLVNGEKTIKVPSACYDSVEELVNAIQFCALSENISLEKAFTFIYHASVKRAYLKIHNELAKSVSMSRKMADMLGFHDNVMKTSSWAVHEPSLTGGLEVMYIYANILEPQIVGDISAPLLRIVNVEGKYPSIIDKTFDFPHYIPILVKDISDIEINIKDDLDEFIHFVSGKVIVKLHFRKIKQSYF